MFVEDFSVFMSTAGFAKTATLNWEPVTGIFDSAYALASVGPYGMASSAPSFTLPSAQVPANPVGKLLVFEAATADDDEARYTVTASEPDGTGVTRLLLEVAL